MSQISWYFLGIFIGNLEYSLVKIWFNIGIFRQDRIDLAFGFCGCHFIGIGLVSVYHFPENGISSLCVPSRNWLIYVIFVPNVLMIVYGIKLFLVYKTKQH